MILIKIFITFEWFVDSLISSNMRSFFCIFKDTFSNLWFFSPFWDLGVLQEKLRIQASSKKKPTQDPEKRTKTFMTILYKNYRQLHRQYCYKFSNPSWNNSISVPRHVVFTMIFVSPEPISICSYSTIRIAKKF